jgi:methionyl-tRNA formyltransferase
VPGTVVAADKKKLLVATGEGVLSLSRVVPPGKRDMAVDEFLRGHKISPGARFTSEEHPNN